MGKKLYVGNLSYDVDSSALQELFSAHGTVQSAEIISENPTFQRRLQNSLRLHECNGERKSSATPRPHAR